MAGFPGLGPGQVNLQAAPENSCGTLENSGAQIQIFIDFRNLFFPQLVFSATYFRERLVFLLSLSSVLL